MRKSKFYLLGLFMALAPLFVSCSSEDDSVATYTVSVLSGDGGSVSIEGTTDNSVTLEAGSSVTVVATPDADYNLLGWFVGDSETPVSTDVAYTFTVDENIELCAKFIYYRAVDLGLPSGIKWATCNVGATAPEEYGGYYAWGETEEKEDYSWATYKWCNGDAYSMNKYCTNSDYGTVDNKINLEPADDVAAVKWGGAWRMPMAEEQEELEEYCTWTKTTLNGVDGYKVTGPNGNSIFLPSAGYRTKAEMVDQGHDGYYYSNSLYNNQGYYAYGMRYYYEHNLLIPRFFGCTVRPVYADVPSYTVSVTAGDGGSVGISGKMDTSVTLPQHLKVTVYATPDDGYSFIGWFVGDSETPVSTVTAYTFHVTEDVELIAKFITTPSITPGQIIDLGLPSGTKWAAWNVGATKPEEYGGYYAWGETEEKEDYDWDTYKWCNGTYYTLTKYCTVSNYGTVDNKTVLDPEDDVATVKWGGNWRMPTEAEQNELRGNCTRKWTTLNGVNGYRVTGPNGNSIFLPAAGYRYGTYVSSQGSYGYYWSASLTSRYSSYACSLGFDSSFYDWNDNDRYYGHTVRPVYD